MGQKDRVVALPGLQRFGQERSVAASGCVQFVNDPKHAVYAQAVLGSDSTKQSVAGQQDTKVSKCGDKTEAVIGGKAGKALLEDEGLSDLVCCQVVRDHPGIVELSPLLFGEVRDFGPSYGQRDNESVWQSAECGR